MSRPAKVFHPQAAQSLMRAVIGQAILDCLEGSTEEKADAEDFLFTERSDLHYMSQGIADPDSFRPMLRKAMSADTVRLFLENSKYVTIERKQAA
jgi:hypothetical protein